MRQVTDKIVVVQSCGLDRDLDLVANIGIGRKGKILHRQHVSFTDRKISYPDFVRYRQIGEQMTHEEFDTFLNDNEGAVLDLVVSLLEPGEIKLLGKEKMSG